MYILYVVLHFSIARLIINIGTNQLSIYLELLIRRQVLHAISSSHFCERTAKKSYKCKRFRQKSETDKN